MILVLTKSKTMNLKKRVLSINIEEAAVDFFNHLLQEKPRIPVFIPLILIAWAVERWLFSASSWVPLALAVWTTIQVLTPHFYSLLLSCHLFMLFSQICLHKSYFVMNHLTWLINLISY